MSEPRSIKQIMLAIAATAAEPTGKLLRSCPFIQAELIKQGKISLDDLTDTEIDKLVEHSFLEDWIDAQDVMHYLHISPRTLQTLRTNGTLPFSRIGNKLYYRKQDIQKILADNYTMYKIRNYGSDK